MKKLERTNELVKDSIVNRVNEYIKNNLLLFLISLIIITLSSIVSLVENSLKIYDYYKNANSHFRKYDIAQEKIDKLSIELQVDYYKSILGEPAIINKFKDENLNDKLLDANFIKENLDSCGQLEEYIFNDDLFFVQAVVEHETKTVKGYSITSKKLEFKPVVFGYKINQDFFNKLDFNPIFTNISANLSVKNFEYKESHYGGNPTNYTTFYLGQNDSSPNYLTDSSYNVIGLYDYKKESEREQFYKENQESFSQFREHSTFNVVGHDFDRSLYCFGLGPDWLQARINTQL